MQTLTPGQIYLADQRGIIEKDGLTRWCTFNYDDYADESRQPFGALLTLNDELFAAGHNEKYQTSQPVWVVVVPITGAVECKDDSGHAHSVDVGQVLVQYVPLGGNLTLNNGYEDSRINFLYMEFAATNLGLNSLQARVYDFDLEGKPNQLINAVPGSDVNTPLPFTMSVGMFEGRGENLYRLSEGSQFFAFVIAGAFEMQGRLLHQRDGLSLWNTREVDMEALSNNAVMLVIEMKK